MSRFPPPQVDPDAVRAAARQLATAAEQLRSAGRGIESATAPVAMTWVGTPSLLFLAHASEAQDAARRGYESLVTVSVAADRYATTVEQARSTIATLNQRYDAAVAEGRAARQRAPAGQYTARDVPAEARGAERALEGQYDLLTADVDRSAIDLERALREHDPLASLPGWVRDGLLVGYAMTRGGTLITRSASYGRWFHHTVAAAVHAPRALAWVSGASPKGALSWALTVLHLSRAEGAQSAFRFGRTPRFLAGVRTVVGRAFLPITLATGINDLRTGGGYTGARGAATRALGFAGAVGAGALLASSFSLIALGPVGLGIAGAAVIAYGAWSLGNLVWDDREAIGRFFSRVGNGVVAGAREVGAEVADRLRAASSAVNEEMR